MVLSLLCTLTTSAQGYNLFSAEDVDENGWLWFNTQEKIDKYVGLCNEDDYTVNPNGKPVQMAYANITPDYPETVADPEMYGADTEGYVVGDDEVKSEELIKGAIALAPASGMMSPNGGCLILNLPSCSTISLYLSSEARMLIRTLKLSPEYAIDDDGGDGTGNTKVICSKASVFSSLHSAGQYKWETAATTNNGNNTGVTFVSDDKVYFALQNCHYYPIFVHGIKVTTPKDELAFINEITNGDSNVAEKLYSVDGKYMGKRKNAAKKGVYVVKKGNKTQKMVVK